MRLLAGLLLVGVCLARVSADLVLVGGGLADDNSDVYGKFVELAVSCGRVGSRRDERGEEKATEPRGNGQAGSS